MRAWLAALACAAALAPAAPAAAEPVPSARLSAIGGLRNGTGDLGDTFGLGVLYGIEAAYEPLPEGRVVGYALHWSVLFGDFGSDAAAITGALDILELSLGARLRIAPRDAARSLFLGGGASLLRANTPLPPDDRRDYVGGFAGLGLEQLAWRRALVTLEVRYGLIGPGPGSVSVLLGIGFGT